METETLAQGLNAQPIREILQLIRLQRPVNKA